MEKQPVRPSNKEFWKTIYIHGSTYLARNTKAREMNMPLLRLLHLLFRRSITARKQSNNAEVVKNTDMWIFYCLHEGLKIRLGDLLVGFFRRVLKMSGQVLFGGSYVARLVRRLDGALPVFGQDPLFQKGFAVTTRALAAHEVPDLLADRVGKGPAVVENKGANFPPETIETFAADLGHLQMSVSDVLDKQRWLENDFQRQEKRSIRIEEAIMGLRYDFGQYVQDDRQRADQFQEVQQQHGVMISGMQQHTY
ncbi:hypothetical protein LINGRAPRIM_LOCUS2500 [Linum grandiflorum]